MAGSAESDENKLKHLYLRAGFGASAWVFEKAKNVSIPLAADGLISNAKDFKELKIDKEIHSPKYYGGMMMAMRKEKRKKFIKQSLKDEMAMNLKWIEMMAEDKVALREKMTLFWHGHFACTDPVALFALNLNNTIRRNALGNFGDMLMAVAKEPAMLRFLNNQQNKKQSPNENFAREVMELFTIGRGNYTEDDVKNAARAFTGWTTDFDGNFIKRPFQHDGGEKTFMGHTGNFDGEDIMKIILGKKETATFVAGKVYRYFVNQENPNKEIIAELGQKFYDADYDITTLMKAIFLSDWFYDPKNMGNRIKSPIELIVGLKRDFKVEFERPEVVLGLQKILGQVLFHPPNVAGWPGGRSWIDSSSLLYRMKIPEAIFYTSEMDIAVKSDPTESAGMANVGKRMLQIMKNNADLGYYQANYGSKPSAQIVDDLSTTLLAPGVRNPDGPLVSEFVESAENDKVRSTIMRITSLPEYQMC